MLRSLVGSEMCIRDRSNTGESEAHNCAVHLTIEAAEPQGPLRCARTYTLSCGSDPVENDPVQKFTAQNVERVQRLYSALTECLDLTAGWVARNPSCTLEELGQTALEMLMDREPEMMTLLPLPEGFELVFHEGKSCVNALESSLPLTQERCRSVHVLKLTLRSIPSTDPSCDVALGAVTVSDSFMFDLFSHSVYNITRPKMELASGWSGDGAEAARIRDLSTELVRCRQSYSGDIDGLGELLDDALAIEWELEGSMLGKLQGEACLFEHGLLLSHKRLGDEKVLLSSMHAASAEQVQGEFNQWGLQLTRAHDQPPLFGAVGSRRILLWLPPATVQTTLPQWKQSLVMLNIDLQTHQHTPPADAHETSLQELMGHLAVSDPLTIPIRSDPVPPECYTLIEPRPDSDSRIGITVLCGVSGSGKTSIAESIMSVTAENLDWLLVSNSLQDGLAWQEESVCESLADFAAQPPTEGRTKQVMVISPAHVSMAKVMRTLCCHPMIKDEFYVTGAGCVLNMQQLGAYESTMGESLDNLKQYLYDGWSQCVLLNRHEQVQAEFTEHQEDKLRRFLPSVTVMKVSNGRVLSQSDRRSLLGVSNWHMPSMQVARMQSAPGWMVGWRSSHTCRIKGVYVSLGPRPLKDRFTLLMRKLLQPGSEHGRLLRVTAFIRLGGNEEEYTGFEALGKKMRWLSKASLLAPPFAPVNHPNSQILLVGEGLVADELLRALTDTREPLREMVELKTVESLTRSEIDAVNKKRQTDPCPEGMYFTGVHWVNFYGDVTFEHPCLPQFLEEYVEVENQAAKLHNAQVEIEWADADNLVAKSFVCVDGAELRA
eukprot:TRINITY_DN11232_c0_g1_i4.p1 TRINITY_DN11232_c0_g1~~TRINITY_DN11232_c0_g1_i4.p1  ORF type:complete len:830 (+),score=175.84 TRINITY_DN11232_c0_g1_i4:117-2606(+)